MKRFGLFVFVLLSLLCLAVCGVAEEVSTPTDAECTHAYTEWKAYDQNTCMMYCSDCGEPTGVQQGHVEVCTARGVCHTCGSADVNLQFGHSGGTTEPTVQFDAYTHWTACAGCNEKLDEAQHTGATCDNNACEVCGAECAEELVEHYLFVDYLYSYDYNDAEHWLRCDRCKKVMSDPEPHTGGDCVDASCDGCHVYYFPDPPHIGEDIYLYIPNEAGHFLGCTYCDSPVGQPSEPHEVSCMDGSVCLVCSKPNPEDAIVKHNGTLEWASDATYHWQQCSDCYATTGEKLNVGTHDHFANCTICGHVCTHENTEAWKNVGEEHGRDCIDCGMTVDLEAHYSDGTPGVCAVCGADFTDCENGVHAADYSTICSYDDESHYYPCIYCGEIAGSSAHYGGTWWWDETYHWIGCNDCSSVNQGGEKSLHAAGCDDPEVCQHCSYVGVSEDRVFHTTDYSKYVFDEKEHWYTCYCGEKKIGIYTHEAFCDDPNTCGTCDAVLPAPMEVDHVARYEGADGFDETSHWWYCTLCGQIALKENHWAWCDWPNYCDRDDCTNTTEIRHCGAMSDADHDPETHALTCYCKDIYYDFTNYVTVKQATCLEDGLRTKRCSFCNELIEEILPATGHNVTEWNETDDRRHQGTCENCGEAVEGYHTRSKTIGYYDNDYCLYECGKCGAEFKGEHIYVTAEDGWFYDETYHYYMCSGCGEKVNKSEHGGANCVFPYCQTCGAEYTSDPSVVAHTISCSSADKTCEKCGRNVGNEGIITHAWGEPVTVPATCTTAGSKTTTCTACGEVTVETIEATGHSFVYQYDDEGYHWQYCEGCQLVTNYEVHTMFEGGKRIGNETECWAVCPLCNAEWARMGHVQDCMGEFCALCETPFIGEYVSHFIDMENGPFVYVNEKVHELECLNCGERAGFPDSHTIDESKTVTVEATCAKDGSITKVCSKCNGKIVETIPATGAHTWGAPVTVDATCVAAGSKTTACTVCGEKTVETIPATGKHAWETVNKVYATCTKAGRTERVCTVCDELSVTTQSAKGHAYGLVFITEGNGTHAKTCETCGAKHVEDCVLNSTEMGNMVCSACATCGYAVYTMTDNVLEEVEELTEAKAEIEVKRVENVSFEIVAEPAEEGTEAETETTEPVETADVVLVVHETQLEMTVELPEVVNASVKKVLAVSMLKEGNAIQPASKVKLSIPVVEEEVSGLKLVLMGEDGELVEIEYEIIDGVIVFETDMVGIFLFVEAEA